MPNNENASDPTPATSDPTPADASRIIGQRTFDGPIVPIEAGRPISTCCADCGVSDEDADLTTSADGTDYCGEHYDVHFTVCHECNEELDRDEVTEDDDGNEYHESCHDEVFTRCDSCRTELHRDNDSNYSPEDGRYDCLCESCYMDRYTRCEDCDSEVHNDNTHSCDGNVICDSCYERNYSTCDDCGDCVHNDNTFCRDSGTYCSDCEGSHSDDEDDDYEPPTRQPGPAARPGHDVPRFPHATNSFQRTRSRRKFAVELETASCDGYRDYRGKFYFADKNDGSITGREFVSETYSDTKGFAGDKGLDAISAFCGAANRDGFTVDNKCGYHAHFDVNDLCNDQLKAVAYAYYLTYKVWNKFVSRSRRDNSYCGRSSWNLDDLRGARNFRSFAGSMDHYQWLSLAAYAEWGTFEVRLHGGTLDACKVNNWVVAHIRFIDAMSAMTIEQVRTMFDGKTEQECFAALSAIWGEAGLTDYYIARAAKFGTTFVDPATPTAVMSAA